MFFVLTSMKLQIIKIVTILAILIAGGFSCSKEGDADDNKLVTFKIQDFGGEVDPYTVSFALPGIFDARCFNGGLPYHSSIGFPESLNPKDWTIHLAMKKGTNKKKLAPIITLAPGSTITPKSGTVLDFSKNIEWTLQASDGSTVNYYMASVFVAGDTDEANMVSIKIKCANSGAVDPNIISLSLPGIVFATCYDFPRYPDYRGIPGEWSPHWWTIHTGLTKGIDCTKIAPIFSLALGARITEIQYKIDGQFFSKQVNYAGIVKVSGFDFSRQVSFVITSPDGSTVTYHFIATAISDWDPCVICP